MEEFIQNHIFWIAPIVGVALTVVCSSAGKPTNEDYSFAVWGDVGVDLTIVAVLMLLAFKPDSGGIIIMLFSIIVQLVFSLITARYGWTRDKQKKLSFVIIGDSVSLALVVLAALFIGGVI